MISYLPSPTQGVWFLGPLPLRAYALCIMVGIVVAVWWGERRFQARGARPGVVLDVAAWAVPFGIVGGRLYHVITTWQPYFGPGGDPFQALLIWKGGLGIWGAVALGALGAWIGCRRAGVLLPPFGDALAPAIVLAQGIGRWGNWFNNELFGSPTTVPWGLQVHEWDNAAGRAVIGANGQPVVAGIFQPTFLYESIWDVGTAVVLVWADRRFKLGHGRVFALYGLVYTIGRFWIEALRIDEANHILGLRLNLWTAVLVAIASVVYLVRSSRLRPGRETSVLLGAAVGGDIPVVETGPTDAAATPTGVESGAGTETEPETRPDAEPRAAETVPRASRPGERMAIGSTGVPPGLAGSLPRRCGSPAGLRRRRTGPGTRPRRREAVGRPRLAPHDEDLALIIGVFMFRQHDGNLYSCPTHTTRAIDVPRGSPDLVGASGRGLPVRGSQPDRDRASNDAIRRRGGPQ